jgi:branched-chain amino acid transport system permease protein
MSAFYPFIVIGLFTGSVYGLAAMGVVLTYKTVGVFNLAYGAVAMFCAYTYWELHDNWGITAWLAMPILFFVVAPLLGLILEGIYRPLAGLSAEVTIVVSLGILGALGAVVPIMYGSQDRQLQAIFPVRTFVLIGTHLHVGYDQIGTLVISLSMAALLWALLRHTKFGTSTRAVVDNPDLADMIGVHGDNVRRAAWILSSVFAALVGILISPSQGLDVNELVLVVIYCFAPAVLGRMVSLPLAYIGGLVLGIVGSILSKYSNSGTISDIEAAIPYLALFVLLVVLGPRLKEAGTAPRRLAVATVSAPKKKRRTPALASFDEAGRRRITVDRSLGIGLIGFVLAVLVPLAVSGAQLLIIIGGVIYALIALTLIVLTGWAGQISLAQFSFVGIGAFTAGHLAGSHGQHFIFAVLVGMLLAAIGAIIVGLASLRLAGLYLALATLAFALVMDTIVFNRIDVSGGETGITVQRPDIFGISFSGKIALYELVVVVFGLIAVGAFALRAGPMGRRLHILRDSPMAASTLGVNLTVTKLVVFTGCAMVAALGGALYGAWAQAITPLDFMWSASLELLLLVVLGGRRVISGAVIAGSAVIIQAQPGIPVEVNKILTLSIALGVIGLAQEPEGTARMTARQTMHVLAVMRPLPKRSRPGIAAARPSGSSDEAADLRVPVAAGTAQGATGHGG